MAFFWMVVVIATLFVYIMLDGYGLGIALLTLVQREAASRRAMLDIVVNVWDLNQVWIVLLAMGLWAGLPEVYATALPGLYLPLIVFLFANILRGFSIEMASRRPGTQVWLRLWGVGSLVTAFAEGVVFGGLLAGLPVRDGRFLGGTWDFFGNGYAVLTGVATVVLFALAGAAWLQAKTEGELRDWAAVLIRRLTLAMVAAVAACALILPLATSAVLRIDAVDRWVPFVYAILVAAGAAWTVYHRAGRRPDGIPFVAVAAAEAAGLVALVALYFPQLVPPSVTLYTAASPHLTLDFLTVAVCAVVPLTVVYHTYGMWVFRGREQVQDGGPAAAAARPSGAQPSRASGMRSSEGGS